jgi:hypothetical protein
MQVRYLRVLTSPALETRGEGDKWQEGEREVEETPPHIRHLTYADVC